MLALRGEAGDDGGRAQAAKAIPSSIEATTLPPGELMKTTLRSLCDSDGGSGEIDERLRRAFFDHAVGDDHLGAFRAAIGRAER